MSRVTSLGALKLYINLSSAVPSNALVRMICSSTFRADFMSPYRDNCGHQRRKPKTTAAICSKINLPNAGMAELADAADSKSAGA